MSDSSCSLPKNMRSGVTLFTTNGLAFIRSDCSSNNCASKERGSRLFLVICSKSELLRIITFDDRSLCCLRRASPDSLAGTSEQSSTHTLESGVLARALLAMDLSIAVSGISSVATTRIFPGMTASLVSVAITRDMNAPVDSGGSVEIVPSNLSKQLSASLGANSLVRCIAWRTRSRRRQVTAVPPASRCRSRLRFSSTKVASASLALSDPSGKSPA